MKGALTAQQRGQAAVPAAQRCASSGAGGEAAGMRRRSAARLPRAALTARQRGDGWRQLVGRVATRHGHHLQRFQVPLGSRQTCTQPCNNLHAPC